MEEKNAGIAVRGDGRDGVVQTVDGYLEQVKMDLDKAKVGSFCSIRAGIWMLCMKDFHFHGEFTRELAAAFPGKSLRVLRYHMDAAKKFTASLNVSAQVAWEGMKNITDEQFASVTEISAASARPMLTGGGEFDTASALAHYFAEKKKYGKKADKAGYGEPATPLTEHERMATARDEAERIADVVLQWVDDGEWMLVDNCHLDFVVQGITDCMDRVKAAMKGRKLM